MIKNRLLSFCCLAALAILVASCGTKANSHLIDGKYGLYEVSVQNYGNCGGIWHGKNMCIENLRPQITGLGADICGKTPHAIRDCSERDVEKGREVFCMIECNKPPKVSNSIIRKARLCQERGGIWIENRCEIDLTQ